MMVLAVVVMTATTLKVGRQMCSLLFSVFFGLDLGGRSSELFWRVLNNSDMSLPF